MKKILSLLCLIAFVVAISSCNNTETYADKRKKEDAAISKFLKGDTELAKFFFDKKISVISEIDFEKAGYTTNVDKNEFVLFTSSGIYMQVVRKGCGAKIESGETATVLCRFNEYNLLTDSLILSNNFSEYRHIPEKMSVTNNYDTFTGTLFQNSSLLYLQYGSTAVPSAWLTPLRFVKVGRQSTPDEEIAKVNIIAPSSQGQSDAASRTYPCYYEITYERGL